MYCDQETSLCLVGDRYYDPKSGRWITPDRLSVAWHVERWKANMGKPTRIPLEANPYVYVANNPLRWVDRTGRFLDDWEPSGPITHDPIRWGPPQLPANGNLWPGSNPDQDMVCTAPAGIFNTWPCTKKCCVQHDLCYKTFGCNFSSWARTSSTSITACQICNLVAMQCILTNIGKSDCDNGNCVRKEEEY